MSSRLQACVCLNAIASVLLLGTAVEGVHEVALFPSSGCYSHDVMMREVGTEFTGANVTWLQVYMYEFGFGMISIPSNWTRLSLNGFDTEGAELMQKTSALIFEMNVPMDLSRPWDLRGIFSFLTILQRNQRFCGEMLRSKEFINLRSSRKFDLIVVDHFLQECMTSMASTLNATTVQFSNWPIADGYVTSLNIPANPSSIPKTGTTFSSFGMTFMERVTNTIFHVLIIFTRSIQIFTIRRFFEHSGYSEMDMNRIEAEHLLYAGRSELLFDSVRPINNRIRHFGCPTCGLPENYHIQGLVRVHSSLDNRLFQKHDRLSPNLTHTKCEGQAEMDCAMRISRASEANVTLGPLPVEATVVPEEASELEDEQQLQEATRRFDQVQLQFPEINFTILEHNDFILISFGSVAQIEYMPPRMLDVFLNTLASLRYIAVWQTNSNSESFLNGRKVPSNVVLVRWAPLKILLAHRRLLYFVCHGGINTVNEVLMFGVPVLGIPLQGDQSSNLRRLVDLGMGMMVTMNHLNGHGFKAAISLMEKQIEKFSTRAKEVAQMASTHRSLSSRSQNFWLHWAARNGPKLRAPHRNYFHFAYRSSFQYFAVSQLSSAATLLLFLCIVLAF